MNINDYVEMYRDFGYWIERGETTAEEMFYYLKR